VPALRKALSSTGGHPQGSAPTFHSQGRRAGSTSNLTDTPLHTYNIIVSDIQIVSEEMARDYGYAARSRQNVLRQMLTKNTVFTG
jgi:hypothetical protein